MVRWLCLIAVLLVGCGSCGEDGTSSPGDPDVGVRTQPDAPAGPCQGCFDEDGVCQPGEENDACGAGGTDCSECDAETQCTDDGECVMPPECGPDTCDGCCTADDECVGGTDDATCGDGGIRCSACPDGAACSDGRCAFACGPDNCNGCCDAAGECQPGDLDLACGTAGVACDDCEAGGAICGGGACVEMGCSQTCAGCCAGDQCVDPATDDQCGAAGDACAACPQGERCLDGSCEAPDDSKWDFVLLSAEIAPTKPNGSNWDVFTGPDPFAWARAVDPVTAETWEGVSTLFEDEFTPVWDEVLLSGVTAEALADGVEFELWEYDATGNDPICLTTLDADPATMSGQVVETICDTDSRTTWRWRLEVAE